MLWILSLQLGFADNGTAPEDSWHGYPNQWWLRFRVFLPLHLLMESEVLLQWPSSSTTGDVQVWCGGRVGRVVRSTPEPKSLRRGFAFLRAQGISEYTSLVAASFSALQLLHQLAIEV
jgi:hypothetical protein